MSIDKLPAMFFFLVVLSLTGFSETGFGQVSFPEQLQEVVSLVESHFYDQATTESSKWNQAVRNAKTKVAGINDRDRFAECVNELLSNLEASHTRYFSTLMPERYQLLGVFNRLFEPDREDLFVYEGIGIGTRKLGNQFEVLSVYDGFPAKKSGLRYGDRIDAVDGQPFHPIKSFQGKAGETVSLGIVRANVSLELKVKVVKLDGRTMFEKSARASVQTIKLNDQEIGYIHLWSYAGVKYQELLKEQILFGKLSKCDALVLDLRDGWGGADLNYLNLFRPPIAITSYQGRDGSQGSYSGVWEKPVALLVNRRSTSGKELFSYGFKKLKLGLIVGDTTAGAVVAGRIFLLPSGDVLYLAVRDVTVDNMRLEKKGVIPDVPIPRMIMDPNSKTHDNQLEAALNAVSALNR